MNNFFDNLIDIRKEKNICITGMTDEFFCVYLSKLFKEEKRNILLVTSTLYEANKLMNSLNNYTNKSLLFPMDDFLTSESIAISPDLKITRLDTLNQLLESENHIVVTHLNGLLRYLPTKELFRKKRITLKKDEDYEREELIKNLISLGYKSETIVNKTGEIGIRGFVIDIFPIGEENPIRIEYFGDTIDSIRYFDETTQKTIKEINEIEIKPYTEFLLEEDIEIEESQKNLPIYNKKISSIIDYLDNPIVVFKDYSQIETNVESLRNQIFEYKANKDTDYEYNYMFDFDEIIYEEVIHYNTINNLDSVIKKSNTFKYDVHQIRKFNENIEAINEYLKKQLYINKTIVICLRKHQIKTFPNYLECPYVITNENKIIDNTINIIEKSISEGFEYKNYIVLSENELFKVVQPKKKYKTSFKYSAKIKNLSNIEIGDYVVHDIHGIGIYNGIKSLTQNGLLKDYLEIIYSGKDKLYIPVEKIDLINKFTGKEGVAPKVNKLGGTEWQKTKLRIKKKVQDIAGDLIKLYATREMKQGYKFSPDNELQIMFEKEFEYDETADQLLAINQIKQDMESTSPMDRLLCGDVGFGKTEVAFRAMMKAALDSKQVLYLCPTTILSMQQYDNAIERFKNYPVKVEVLNRFTTPKETNRILNELKDGSIDILFGTHRLLSSDIKPKDLGLLVVDEEQRFGVTHKEKIKQYKENVDVLTLTATPIPRTLQMSLVGIRNLSLIETPPTNRYPVQTYVIEENNQLIKDAVYKEMSRNGQVFILYNSVEKIERKMYELQNLIPDAKIVITHGQLSKSEIEERMEAFINHEYDIMLCTTIIETGIDIPNANTLIILNADRFGLSQLYQIRGRVGRSDKIAYAYLMYEKQKQLNETAIKRLNVIKEFTELGSGFAIATRDLSIRGAGDILGSEQAGFIDSVGIDLYLKILDEEVKRLKGEVVEEETQTKDEKPFIQVSTHIKDEYIDDQNLKIEIHRKINEIDSYSKLIEIKTELEDRFGKLDEDMILYMHEEWFEKLAKKLDIIQVMQTRNSVSLIFSSEMSERIDGEQLFLDACQISRMFRFQFKNKNLVIVLDTIKLEKHYLFYLLSLMNKIKLKENA
ncbi:MAG: transcription-repair coupling factor [Firmicutes bacterium]|nr:transcription-repair coupling factor [Bacillota bacterium]